MMQSAMFELRHAEQPSDTCDATFCVDSHKLLRCGRPKHMTARLILSTSNLTESGVVTLCSHHGKAFRAGQPMKPIRGYRR